MKISSWNVNGLRAVLRKGAWKQFLDSNPGETICLQEIKMHPHQLGPEAARTFAPYFLYWHPAERAGYSGVLTLSKSSPDEVVYGLGNPEYDREGRVIRSRWKDIWLINVYVPNGKRDHSRVEYKLAYYAELLELSKSLAISGQQVIICGDINTAHQEIDLKNAKANENTTGFLPVEREWITRFIEAGYVDIFRQRHPEKEQYTWWSYVTQARRRNVGWRLDYFLISEELSDRVISVSIRDEIPGSDHCPVELIIDI